jgi:hypothetical protein
VDPTALAWGRNNDGGCEHSVRDNHNGRYKAPPTSHHKNFFPFYSPYATGWQQQQDGWTDGMVGWNLHVRPEIRNHSGVGALPVSLSVHFTLRFVLECSKIRAQVFFYLHESRNKLNGGIRGVRPSQCGNCKLHVRLSVKYSIVLSIVIYEI